MAMFLISRLIVGLSVGMFAISAAMVVRAGTLILEHQSDAPTIGEQERHLDSNDKRLDAHDERFNKMVDLINDKFDRLESDRQARKQDSDKRYDDLRQDVTRIYGGIAVIAFLLGAGMLKLFTGNGTLRLSKEDTTQLGYLLSGLRDARGDSRNGKESEKWNR